jgi:hypothetical protein
MKLITNVLKTNLSLKSISFLLGFFCWFIFSNTEHSSITLEIPICTFGDSEQAKELKGIETVQVELSGKRSDLYALDRELLGLHINLDELEAGDHLLEISPEKLFLPSSIKLVHWSPSNPVITVIQKSTKA